MFIGTDGRVLFIGTDGRVRDKMISADKFETWNKLKCSDSWFSFYTGIHRGVTNIGIQYRIYGYSIKYMDTV